MTVYALIVSLSMTVLMGALAFAFWLRRREHPVHGWVTAWLVVSAVFLAFRLAQMVNPSPELAPTLARATLTASLCVVWATFQFATAYLDRRPTLRDLSITGAIVGVPIVMAWCSDLLLTGVVVTRVLWGRDAFLGVNTGPLVSAFPAASLIVGTAGVYRLVRARVTRDAEGVIMLAGYLLMTIVLLVDLASIARGSGAARFSDFSALPLGLAFGLVQVHRYAQTVGELQGRVDLRTHELAAANERLLSELAHSEALHDKLARVQRMEALGRLAGGVAHDFNNLLTVILGNAGLLRASVTGKAVLHVGHIEQAAKSAGEVTRQLLVFGRRQVMARRVADVRDIVERLRTLLTRVIGEDVRIEISLGGAAASALVDPSQIEQIVVNLALNARDAMPEGGTLSIDVDVVVLDEPTAQALAIASGPYVRLTVADTGTGMSDEIRARVFDPFFTTKPTGTATGLGLSIVYGATRQNDGAISLDTAPGRGATFRVYLPCAANAAPTIEARDSGAPRGRERVWLVEDQPLVRAFVEAALAQLGYSVRSFASGEQLLESLASIEPAELLVTDLVLPNIDGYALAARVTAALPGVRVVFASGYSDHVAARHGGLGEDAILITKPFTVEGLATAVRGALDRERAVPTTCRHALVVDDDPMVLTVVSGLLESLGCVVSTEPGPEALDAALERAAVTGTPVDLVVVDINLEGTSGFEVCRRLRQAGLALPILCMSGDLVSDETWTEAGFDGVLEKPVEFAELSAVLRKFAGYRHRAASPG